MPGYSSSEILVESADGMHVRAEDGRVYLDACAGTFNVGLGYGHRHVVSAMRKVLDSGFLHGSAVLGSSVSEEACRALSKIAPGKLDHCYLKGSTGGSTAVEQAIRHAWALSGRSGIISFVSSHHGQTIFTSQVSGMTFRKERILCEEPQIRHVRPPDCRRCPFGKKPSSCSYECVDDIKEAIFDLNDKGEGAAAMVAEPVLGAGGGVVPPKQYWKRVREVLDANGVLLIFDEVQTFGRLGDFFSDTYYDIVPDFICLAKSISGIGVPGSGALLLNKEACVLEDGERSLTWGGSSLVASAISATIATMSSGDFFLNTTKASKSLERVMQRIVERFQFVWCHRTLGLMSGFEVGDADAPNPTLASRIVESCRRSGLLVRQAGYGRSGFIEVRPSLICSSEEVEKIEEKLVNAMSSLNI